MTDDISTWAGDHSLFYRLKDAVECMMRGKGKWGDRAKYVFSRLAPVTPDDFPPEYRTAFALICELRRVCTAQYEVSTLTVPRKLTPRQRQLLCDALLFLYERMLIARSGQFRHTDLGGE